jgi:hypothetical protein
MIKYLEIIDLSEKGIVYDELKKSILKESSYQHNIYIIKDVVKYLNKMKDKFI